MPPSERRRLRAKCQSIEVVNVIEFLMEQRNGATYIQRESARAVCRTNLRMRFFDAHEHFKLILDFSALTEIRLATDAGHLPEANGAQPFVGHAALTHNGHA